VGEMVPVFVALCPLNLGILCRLQAHNGLIKGGAKATRRGRPWTLVAHVEGFASESDGKKPDDEFANPRPTKLDFVRAV
jgi:hypothetical protein